MDLSAYGLKHGFIEAKLWGYRLTFLKPEHYLQIKALNTLEELFQFLQTETDYGEYIDFQHVSIHALRKFLKQKLDDEVTHIEINCHEQINELIFYVRADHMIDNIMMILDGVKNNVPFRKLINNIEPLGTLPELGAIEAACSDLAVLYETVLIDTPLAEIFSQFLEENTQDLKSFAEVQGFLSQEKSETIKNGLKKILFSKMFEFTQSLNEVSKEGFQEAIGCVLDNQVLQIVYNSMTDNKVDRLRTRESLCSPMSPLFQQYFSLLINADSVDDMRTALQTDVIFSQILADVPDSSKNWQTGLKTLDDLLYKREVDVLCDSFNWQGNLAVIFAYVRLKQQEIRNIVWLAEMIQRQIAKNDSAWDKVIVPFG